MPSKTRMEKADSAVRSEDMFFLLFGSSHAEVTNHLTPPFLTAIIWEKFDLIRLFNLAPVSAYIA